MAGGTSVNDESHCSNSSDALSSQPLTLPSDVSLNEPPNNEIIPTDLILNILQLLPVKSLVRFKSVCKHWNSLISDPQFAKNQLRASAPDPTRNHLIMFTTHSREPLLKDYPVSSIFSTTSIAIPSHRTCHDGPATDFHFLCGSCHGILCISTSRYGPILWNPSIGKFKNLPSLKFRARQGLKGVSYGFGYDHCHDSYKVVAVYSYGNAKINTLGINSWRVTLAFSPTTSIADAYGKFVSGTLNWLAVNLFRYPHYWVISSLDVATETCRELSLPFAVAVSNERVSLTSAVLKDCLSVIVNHDMASDVWVMKDYGNERSWTMLFRIPLRDLFPRAVYPLHGVAICVSEDGEILMEYESKYLAIYDSKNGTFRPTAIRRPRAGCLVVNAYYESLISPCR